MRRNKVNADETLFDRFWEKVDKNAANGCWLWTASLDTKGYGQIGISYDRKKRAHVVSYVWSKGEVPEGKEIDHLCRNRACVNPEHLEAVSHRENCLRGPSENMVLHRSGKCKRGHLMTPENTWVSTKIYKGRGGPKRQCRICHAARSLERYRRSRETTSAA